MLSAASGVSTLTAPSVWFQYCQTASIDARAAPLSRTRRSRAGGLVGVASRTEREHDLALLSVGQFEGHLERGTRVEGRAHAPGERRPEHRRRLPQAAVAADELGAVPRHAAARIVDVEERHPAAELGVVGVSRDHRTGIGIDAGHHVRGGLPAKVAEDPLDVGGDRDAARPAGGVADREDRPLHRRRQVHVHRHGGGDAVLDVFEHAVAEPVAAGVRPVAAGRQRRRRPEAAALLVAQVEGLAAAVGDRVVVPRRQAEFVRVLRPGVGRPALGDDGAEDGVREDVHPGRRRRARPARS